MFFAKLPITSWALVEFPSLLTLPKAKQKPQGLQFLEKGCDSHVIAWERLIKPLQDKLLVAAMETISSNL